MNRRKLFVWLAASPFLGALITKVAASPSPAIVNDATPATPAMPVGFIVDEWFHIPANGMLCTDERGRSFFGVNMGYPRSHSITDPGHGYVDQGIGSAMRRRMIYDGTKFVEFDSQDGADVLNRIIQGMHKARI